MNQSWQAGAAGNGTARRWLMQVLWPAFLMAIVAVGVLFSLVDPHDMHAVVSYLGDSSEGAYTVGFLVFWVLFTASSGLTYLLAHGSRRP
ncbi:MAG: hypothetical protein KJZ83_13495 [Burkholderiaceae bacterium]|nr:hypothetical protein [Burkholderiaceae bacterium]